MREISRRDTLKGAGLGMFGVAAAGCAGAAPMAASAAPSVVGSVALDIVTQVVSTVIADSVEGAWKAGWEAWRAPTRAAVRAERPKGRPTSPIYGSTVPGVSLVVLSPAGELRSTRDCFLTVFQGGGHLTLNSWAWRALDAFIKESCQHKTGDNLLHMRQLLTKTVVPVGPARSVGITPRRTAFWVTYPARDGEVEIVRSTQAKSVRVTVTVSGLDSRAARHPTVRTYELVDLGAPAGGG